MRVLVKRDEYGTVEVFKISMVELVIDDIFKNAANYTDCGEEMTKQTAKNFLKKRGFLSFYEEGRDVQTYQVDICEVK